MATRFLKISSNGNKILKSKLMTAPSYKIIFNFSFLFSLELGSECYPCICEIVDYWWPDDAPNCFKKEIQKITENQLPQNEEEVKEVKTEL